MFAIAIFQNIVMIIAGIASIVLACSWPKGKARMSFIFFIAGFFLILPLSYLATMTLSTFLAQSIGYSSPLWHWLHYFQLAISIFCLFPLVIFAASAKRMFTEQALSDGRSSVRDPNAGPVWDTALSKTQIKKISTKRNLAYVIDLLPLMILVVGSCYLAWMAVQRLINVDFGILFPIGAIFVSAYLLFKDSVNGQSVGKWLLGCRVVSAHTGQPAGPGKSFVRNFLFMLPFMPLVELIVSKSRDDGCRLGDIWAETRVVAGPPQWVDGVAIAEEAPQKKHPLDD